jgi:YesN/AraC family two-component response regulator
MKFSKYDRQIDLLVTDVIMPDMSGPELLNKLKQSHPHLKTLFISGYTDGILDKHNISSSTATFLRKPFTSKALGYKVRELLDLGKDTQEIMLSKLSSGKVKG